MCSEVALVLISGVFAVVCSLPKLVNGDWVVGFAVRRAGIFGYHDVDEGFAIVQRRQVDSDIAAAVWRKIAHLKLLAGKRSPSARTSTRRV